MFLEDPELAERARYGRTILYPGTDGRGYTEWSPLTPESHLSTSDYDFSSPQDNALKHFINLIINPEWAMLGGPCDKCGDYFLKTTNRKRTYCSKSCSSAATAIPSIMKRRQQEQAARINRAQESIAKWQRVRRPEWKKCVSIDTGLTVRWLTRAVNNGQLHQPREARQHG
jgi:hypothetical protein